MVRKSDVLTGINTVRNHKGTFTSEKSEWSLALPFNQTPGVSFCTSLKFS